MRYVQVCKALYDYEARTEDELSIRQDNVLYVIEKEDNDWWKAELKQMNGDEQGPVGLVPADYLEEVLPIGRVRAEYDYTAQQEEELSFQEGQEMDLLEQDDPDWYLVKLDNGDIGLAPSNYVASAEDYQQPEEQEEATPVAAPMAPPAPPMAPPAPPIAPPLPTQASIAPPLVQPVLSHTTGTPREAIVDDAQSWNVHEYDAAKKKKKKGKGNLFIGNGMICYGSETDKSLPVQQFPILDVTKYLYDGKNLHIEIDGAKKAVLDLQASSKSEAKAVLVKIADSSKAAQMSNTHINNVQRAAPAAAISPPIQQHQEPIREPEPEPEPEPEEEESNCVPKWGISIYSFQAEGGDELSVEENEQIYVLDYERTDGWWRVQKVDGDVGLVPSSYVQFDDEEQDDTHTAVSAGGIAAASGIAAAAATAASRADNVQDIRRKREEEERALQQQRMAEEEAAREEQRRRDEQLEQQKRQEQQRKEEELRRRREEEKRREEEERERRKQVQEAAKRAEIARQKQIEEDYRRKEQERKAALARSASKSRHQDLPKPDPTKIRTWTDRSGSFKVEAQFIDFHNGKLRLHKLNGVKIDVPVEKMCAEDIRWVENQTRSPSQQPEVIPSMPPRPPQQQPQQPQQPQQKKLNERWDWFDWFMIIGIPMQASLQYASAFKAEKLDDSDIPNLTHKQMKTLGIKEEHVQRIERYIETGKPEDNEEETKQKEQAQIEKDEELARKLQKEWESSEGASKAKSTSNARPRPNVSAPKDVHPDLLDFIGSQLGSDSSTTKGKEPATKASNDLVGFNDDAWTPRAESSPIAALAQLKTANPPATAVATPPPAPTGPTPEQIKAQEAERKRISEEEQIQKIQLMNLQRQAKEQQQQLEQLQKLTQQQLELQKQLAMQTGTQQQQQAQQQQMLQVQAQQQQLQQQLAQQPSQLQPSFAPQVTGFVPSANTGFNISQSTGFGSQSSLDTGNARPRPTPNNRLSSDPTLGQWQPTSAQSTSGFQLQQATGFQPQQPTGFQPQQATGFPAQSQSQQPSWQALQPQMTGFPASSQPVGSFQQVPLQSVLAPALTPSAAGQQNGFNNGGLQRAQTVSAQPTGRHWGSATPANPFGSPTLSPLQAQMTGVQFSTPSPQAFHQSPLQSQQPTGYMQPQMTGFQPQQTAPPPPQGNNIFTPQGSMQYGQSAFSNQQRPW